MRVEVALEFFIGWSTLSRTVGDHESYAFQQTAAHDDVAQMHVEGVCFFEDFFVALLGRSVEKAQVLDQAPLHDCVIAIPTEATRNLDQERVIDELAHKAIEFPAVRRATGIALPLIDELGDVFACDVDDRIGFLLPFARCDVEQPAYRDEVQQR